LRAVVATRLGGPEVLELQEVPEPTAGPGQVLIRVTSAGVNFADLSSTRGTYAMAPPPPFIPGLEVAGEEVESGKPVFAIVPSGGYAELVAAEERFTWDAEGLDLGAAGGYALTGLTAFHALRHVGGLQAGETVLMTAAAGGVGTIAGQWLKKLGVTAIGTVGSEEKAKLAKAHGYKHVINYSTENFAERVKEITKGKKLPVVYDAVGKSTWDGSLECLQPRGLLVSFGNASGAVPPVNLGILSTKGSLYVTRPTLNTYVAAREDLVKRASDLFNAVKSKAVRIETSARYPLDQAANAHRDLEGRKTTGSVVLIP